MGINLETPKLPERYEALVESRVRQDWVVKPRYVTILNQPSLGAQVQLETLTDQLSGFAHRMEVKVRDIKNYKGEWKNITPEFVHPYNTRKQALEDHDASAEFIAGAMVKGYRFGFDFFLSVAKKFEPADYLLQRRRCRIK